MTDQNIVTVGVGGIHVDASPRILVTYLGSCVAVCLYSKAHKVGGMVHIAMSTGPHDKSSDEDKKGKYADTAVYEMLKLLQKKYKVDKGQVVAKIFGGAKILKAVSLDIGRNNEKTVRGVLSVLDIKIKAFQTGGEKGYRVDFNLDNGKVLCRVFGEEVKEY